MRSSLPNPKKITSSLAMTTIMFMHSLALAKLTAGATAINNPTNHAVARMDEVSTTTFGAIVLKAMFKMRFLTSLHSFAGNSGHATQYDRLLYYLLGRV